MDMVVCAAGINFRPPAAKVPEAAAATAAAYMVESCEALGTLVTETTDRGLFKYRSPQKGSVGGVCGRQVGVGGQGLKSGEFRSGESAMPQESWDAVCRRWRGSVPVQRGRLQASVCLLTHRRAQGPLVRGRRRNARPSRRMPAGGCRRPLAAKGTRRSPMSHS